MRAELPFRTIDTGHFQNFRWNHLGAIDLSDAGVLNDVKTETSCNSITAGGTTSGYSIGIGGSRTFRALTVILTNGFEVNGGEFTVDATDPLGSTSEFSVCAAL